MGLCNEGDAFFINFLVEITYQGFGSCDIFHARLICSEINLYG